MKNMIKEQTSTLRFTPAAWAKLVFLRDIAEAEVGGFGISDQEDLLLVRDIALVKQRVSEVSVSFDDESVADYFEDMVASGKKPEQFSRIWIHTHPGCSPYPSITDEQTFERVFGKCDWSVMAIAALDSSTYARVRFNTGPGSQMPLKLQIDYDKPFEGSDRELWLSQYKENVIFEDKLALKVKTNEKSLQRDDLFGKDIPSLDCEDIISAFELMDPYERDYLLEQLSFRNSLFPESEVF